MRRDDTVSLSEFKVWQYLVAAGQWCTNAEIAGSTHIARRAVEDVTKRLADRGLLQSQGASPRYFTVASKGRCDRAHRARLDQACEIFGEWAISLMPSRSK
jgi:hypothetical protein